MANVKNKEQLQQWKDMSLILLLVLGVVGAVTYTILLRQKERLDIQEVSLTNLSDKVNQMSKELRAE